MLPVLVSDAMLCGAFARRDAASCSRLPSALASALGPILTGVLACDDDVVALLVELRDPSDKAGRLLLCAVTAHVSGCSSALLLSQFDNGDLRLYLCMPLLATARVDLMGNGVLALKSDGQAAYFKVSSILTLWTTAQSLIALRDGGGPGGAPAALLVRPEKQSGVGEELGVDSHDAVEVIGDGLFDMAIVLPPTPTKAGVYRKPDTKALETCISKFIKGAPQPDEITVADVLAHIRSTFGEHIVGKWGYSKAYVDGIVFRVYGELEKPSLILDRLWLGSEFNAQDMAELRACGVSHILNVAVEVDKFFPDDFVYMKVNVLDVAGADILPYLDRVCEFIHDARTRGSGVLVHCQRGVSRSASCVVAYVMQQQRIGVQEAVALVKNRRRIVRPNAGFMQQLKQWAAKLGIEGE